MSTKRKTALVCGLLGLMLVANANAGGAGSTVSKVVAKSFQQLGPQTSVITHDFNKAARVLSENFNSQASKGSFGSAVAGSATSATGHGGHAALQITMPALTPH